MPTVDDRRLRIVAHAGMQDEKEFARRPVGAMNSEAPAAQIGFRTDFGPMSCDDALIVVAPRLGAAGRNAACSFGLDEFNAAGIGKGFFRRIDDLYNMTVGARRRELRDCASGAG